MYRLSIKIEGIEKRKRSTGLLHVLAGCFLLIGTSTLLKTNQFLFTPSLVFSYLTGLLSILYGLLRKKIDEKARYNAYLRILQFAVFIKLGISLVGTGSHWNYISMLIWGVISLLLLFTERKIFHDAQLVLKKEGIHIPGYFNSHHLLWLTVSEMVIRNDYVTIFRSNGKYLQFEVLADLNEVQVQELNHFCSEQINNISKPVETN